MAVALARSECDQQSHQGGRKFTCLPFSDFPTPTKEVKWPTLQKGSRNSKEGKLFFKDASGNFVSPFHDIPMLASEGVYNMVVEVPRWSNAKMEIDTKAPLNPIVQDQKNDKLRFVANVFPYHGYIFNYGAIPQTWEDPNHTDQWTNYKGDKDPIDVCEIGSKIQPTGAVIQVKVLGVFALIDDEETDWKLICIDVTDPLAEKLNDIEDVDTEMPGFLEMAVEWFKKYKIPNKPNPGIEFAFNDKPKNKEFAENIIAGTHEHWKKLMSGSSDPMGMSIINTSLDNTASVDQEQAKGVISELPEQGADHPLPDEIDKWHYVSLD